MDDASDDGSLEMIQELIHSDSRFRLHHNPTNKGCGYTKNKCVDYASGDICAFLDPDDALYSSALKKTVAEFNKDPETVATYSKMMMCDDKLVPQHTFSKIKLIDNSPFFFNCPVQLAHFFAFRRSTYMKTSGTDINLKSAVDQDLYLKILELGNVKFIREDLYRYRLHANGISQYTSKQHAKESFAKVIFEVMKRRGLKRTGFRKIPDSFTSSEEIYQLIEYQTKPLYRLITKVKLYLSQFRMKINIKTDTHQKQKGQIYSANTVSEMR